MILIIGLKMDTGKKLLYFLFSLCCFSCEISERHIHLTNIEETHKQLKQYGFSELKEFSFIFESKSYSVRDSVIESEGESWSALALIINDTVFLTVENSWLNREKVSRVVVYGSMLKTNNNVGVGSSFEDLSNFISFDSWVKFPDGVVGFEDKNNPNISYMMDMSDYQQLLFKPLYRDSFPKDVRVEYILML